MQEHEIIVEARNIVLSLCIRIERDFLFLNKYISFLLLVDNFFLIPSYFEDLVVIVNSQCQRSLSDLIFNREIG